MDISFLFCVRLCAHWVYKTKVRLCFYTSDKKQRRKRIRPRVSLPRLFKIKSIGNKSLLHRVDSIKAIGLPHLFS